MISPSGALLLPTALCRELGLESDDEVVLTVEAEGRISVREADGEQVANAPLRGLLRDYFKDREDIQRFIEEERQGWAEREERLDRQWEEILSQKRGQDAPSLGS